MRKLAYITKIDSITPVEGADKIETAHIGGWKVIVAKGAFKPSDLCVMFEIDSYLDANDPRFAFLRDRCLRKFVSKSGKVLREGIRIRTIKLRGIYSQGVCLPISQFPELSQILKEVDNKVEEPIDVTTILKVDHIDEVKEQLIPPKAISFALEKVSPFPSQCPKTDEERIQNCMEYFTTYRGERFEVTEKRDGGSITFGYAPLIDEENPFMVCSRNYRVARTNNKGETPVMWEVVLKYGFDKICEHYPNLMFQGELCGSGINSNRDKIKGYTIEVFKIYDVEKKEYLEVSDRIELCKKAQIPHVPVINQAMDVFSKHTTLESLLEFADGTTANGNPREGVVFKQCGTTHPRTFKVISNKYLLASE